MATLSTAAQNAALQALLNLLNVGATFAGPAFGVISTAPAFMFLEAIDTAPAFSVSGGSASLTNAPRDLVMSVGGTVRATTGMVLASRGGTTHVFLNVGTVGSGADVELITLSALAGQKLRISAFDVTIG